MLYPLSYRRRAPMVSPSSPRRTGPLGGRTCNAHRVKRPGFCAITLLLLAIACTSPTDPSAVAPVSNGVPFPTPSAIGNRNPAPTVFAGGVFPLTRTVRRHIRAMNWHPGCPVPLDDLRLVRVRYWNFRGQVRTGPLVLNRKVAHDVLWVFRQLFRARFPIHRLDLAPRPKPIDWDSTRNLSSSFNCRSATGNPGVSLRAFLRDGRRHQPAAESPRAVGRLGAASRRE